ncbi:DUF2971 domain-containing protein [Halorubrum sp. CSM-61]|uniref:DUF2971 domain-containing protein n=1 Tax=Halorubrum sp. CSM-61 TaxID=2485838 RepID=UPI000F4C8BD4|nr:DUF2971 domain-containing protein [Halorubrum sp. CSM-61]
MGTDNENEQESRSWSPQLPNYDTPAWRYLDFTQLISILERQSLWFNRADLFEDPLEGSLSRANVETREIRYEDTEIPPSVLETLSQAARQHRKTTYLSCWHLNNYESAAMWEQYSTNEQGIAIQTTVGDLIKSLTDKPGVFMSGEDTPDDADKIDRTITFGKVQYIDYDRQLMPESNLYAPLFFKRLSFEHEREFRAAFSKHFEKLRESDEADFMHNSSENPAGVYVDVNLEKLIDTLYISPTSPEWFSEQVELIKERYGIECDIQKSSLDEDPVF